MPHLSRLPTSPGGLPLRLKNTANATRWEAFEAFRQMSRMLANFMPLQSPCSQEQLLNSPCACGSHSSFEPTGFTFASDDPPVSAQERLFRPNELCRAKPQNDRPTVAFPVVSLRQNAAAHSLSPLMRCFFLTETATHATAEPVAPRYEGSGAESSPFVALPGRTRL